MKKFFLLGMICAIAATPAWAGVNLIGEVASPVSIVSGADGMKEIAFLFRVSNTGAESAQGDLAVKPMLVRDQLFPSWSQENNGHSLPAVSAFVTIPAGDSVTLFVSSILPKITSGNYFLSVVTNSNQSIVETNHVDNASDLIRVGRPSSATQIANTADFDLTHEVRENYSVISGGISHASRTIRNRPGNVVTRDLWAKFFVFDLNSRRAYGLPYNSSSFDKQWYWISWREERDAQGNAIWADYYSQAPIVNHIPPGRYAFATLVNSRELVPEINPFNNLHVRPVEITALKPQSDSEIWIAVDRSIAPQASKSVVIRNSYGAAAAWSANSNESSLAANPSSGTLNGGQSATVNLTASPAAEVTEGVYESRVVFGQANAALGTSEIVVRTFVWNQAPTNLVSDTATLAFAAAQSQPLPAEKLVKLTNSSSAPIQWRAIGDATWLKLGASSGTIAPGAFANVAVSVDAYGSGPGNFRGNVRIQTSVSNTDLVVPVTLSYTAQ